MNAKKAAPAARKKKVFLVDDHPMLRSGLALIISQQKDLALGGEAGDAAEALQRIPAAKPDLAVVDLTLEGKGGLELIKDLKALHPDLPVLVLSMHDESLYAERVLRAGARGYVMKKSGGEAVLEAIRQVLNGQVYVSQQMSSQILSAFAGGRPKREHSPIESLSDREFEVFELIGEGCTTKEIASRLHISPKTVDVHRQNLKQKLKLPNTTSLVQHAVRWVETQNKA